MTPHKFLHSSAIRIYIPNLNAIHVHLVKEQPTLYVFMDDIHILVVHSIGVYNFICMILVALLCVVIFLLLQVTDFGHFLHLCALQDLHWVCTVSIWVSKTNAIHSNLGHLLWSLQLMMGISFYSVSKKKEETLNLIQISEKRKEESQNKL